MRIPAAWNHSATSFDNAADPEMKKRTRPPKRARTLENTSRSATLYFAASSGDTLSPERLARDTCSPTPTAQSKILALAPPSACAIVTMRPYAFSKMRGAAPIQVGRTTARLSMILSTRPSTAVGKPIASWVVSSTLPNECAIGSHRYCRSSRRRMPVAAIASPSYVHPLCRSRTPFGRPVVPDV